MPYLITTNKRPAGYSIGNATAYREGTRQAVATLDEANDATLEARRAEYWPLGRPRRTGQPPHIGPDGGTINLPDGTVIEVTPIEVPAEWRDYAKQYGELEAIERAFHV